MQFDLEIPSPINPSAAQENPEVDEALRIPPKTVPEPESTAVKPADIVEAEPDAQTRNTSHWETLSDNSTPCPHQRACESEPEYNWRTDPYYNEESIRERLKAAKAKNLTEPSSLSHNPNPRIDG